MENSVAVETEKGSLRCGNIWLFVVQNDLFLFFVFEIYTSLYIVVLYEKEVSRVKF